MKPANHAYPPAVYIAGKMTGLPDLGRAHFMRGEERLKNFEGATVLNPACLPVDMPPDRYMPICLTMIDQADAVYMLTGWEDSPGAKLEKAYAEYQGKDVWYEPEF